MEWYCSSMPNFLAFKTSDVRDFFGIWCATPDASALIVVRFAKCCNTYQESHYFTNSASFHEKTTLCYGLDQTHYGHSHLSSTRLNIYNFTYIQASPPFSKLV